MNSGEGCAIDLIAVIVSLITGVLLGSVIFPKMALETIKDEAVERGYAEYVIENKQVVWKWKERE